MSARRVIVVGAGRRVREAALPALESLAGRYVVRSVYARTAKEIAVGDRTYGVRPFDALDAADFALADLVYVAVGKDATPSVLARLAAFDRSHIDLLIDTPVLRFKHFRHVRHLRGYRNAWVAEDTCCLPWYDTVHAALASGMFGELRRVYFERSAYAYHGLAMAKALLGSDRIVRARRTKRAGGETRREIDLANGRSASVLEPRDYAVGRVLIEGTRGAISDRPAEEAATPLEPLLDQGACIGFRIGPHETRLAPAEVELLRGDPPGATVVARMDAMKRVGFRRLLAAIDAGRGGYPVDQALDDMVIDYFLERLGAWRATPLTSARSGFARTVWGLVGRLAT